MTTLGLRDLGFLAAGQGVSEPSFSSVSLLLHGDGTNGSTTITDSSSSPKTVTAFGNAKISTAQSKFGGASIAFDGSGDYIQSSSNADFAFGTGQYTVELWIRFASLALPNEIVATATDTTFGRWTIYWDGTLFTGATGGDGGTTVTWSPQVNTWYHLAVTRDASNAQRIFIDGTLSATATSTYNYTQSGLWAGRGTLGTRFLNGYIDELRITKGFARYTSNFTPPTAPFPDF